MKLTYLKDIGGNNYLGLVFTPELVAPFLQELKLHLSPTEYEQYTQLQQDRDHQQHHLTVFNVMEYNQLIKQFGPAVVTQAVEQWEKIEFHPQLLGLGTAARDLNRTYFIVVRCEDLQVLRQGWGLEPRDLHVTLGFYHQDVFGVSKNTVLLPPNPFYEAIDLAWSTHKNWEFLRKIGNFSSSSLEEIIPYAITTTSLTVAIGDDRLQIGYLEGSNKLWVVAAWSEKDPVTRLSQHEIMKTIHQI